MIAALSVPEHCLSFYFVCDDQIQISCDVWLREMENLAVTFCYLWLTEKLWLLWSTTPIPHPHTPRAPFKTLITLLPVTFSQLGPQLGVVGKKVCTLIGYLLTDGLNFLTRFISSVFRLLCIALWHYVREHIIYTVYSDCVLVFASHFCH